jgi:hypothetical protein
MKVTKLRPVRAVKNGRTPSRVSSYELMIDKQVEKFLDLKQKLIFFLITASVVTIAYTLNYSVAHLDLIIGHFLRLSAVIAGGVLGLLAAGFALFSLSQELASYRLHLDIRYKRMSVEELPKERLDLWNRIKRRAELSQKTAFLLLFLSILFQAAFFLLIVM